MKEYVYYDSARKEILIHGLSISRLRTRVIDTFSSTNMVNPSNGAKYLQLFNSMEYITWEETELRFYSFFALEIYEMISELADKYHDIKYQDIADELYRKTWISNYETRNKIKINLIPLNLFTIQPKDFQLEFIKEYPTYKYQYDLEGYILSFEQGLGKTFTALAIGECLFKDIFYIVCPNSLKEVWADEIKKYYKRYQNNETMWKDEVFIPNVSGYRFTKATKFVIVNQESIKAIFQYIDPKKDSMIIIDESHNFRGNDTRRVSQMLQLKELTGSKDCLLLSGTPIKATANEIVPSLRMIDPHFTPKLAELYNKTFSSTSADAASIVRARFKRVIYRKMKRDVLKLPEKFVQDLKLKIPRPERFATTKAHADIMQAFHEEYISRQQSGIFTNNKTSPFYRSSAVGYDYIQERSKFEKVVRQYSRAKKEITEEYLRKIFQESEDEMNFKLINSLNVDDEYFSFLKKYVVPFVNTSEEREILTTRFNGIFGWAVAAKSATGAAIGNVTTKYKSECFQEIWKYNYQEIIEMILKAKKKTIIFSALVSVVDCIADDLQKKGVKAVKITGNTPGRMNTLNQFKENPDIQVLVTTTQTLSTGVTLTEANQVFFFGTPYRRADFDQACDRIHRIGQDTDCYIYNVLLFSYEKNVTGRIEEILNWSGEMFDSLINESMNIFY